MDLRRAFNIKQPVYHTILSKDKSKNLEAVFSFEIFDGVVYVKQTMSKETVYNLEVSLDKIRLVTIMYHDDPVK